MHVLIIPSWYMGTYNDLNGSFIREQAYALSKSGVKVGVIYNNLVYLSDVARSKKLFSLKTLFFNDNNIPTYIAETFQFPMIRFSSLATRILRVSNRKRNNKRWKKLFNFYIREHGIPDLLHMHSFYPDNSISKICQRHGIKLLITEHWSGFGSDFAFNKKKSIITRAYSGSSTVISVSSYLQNQLLTKLNISSIVIPNIVDTTKFNQSVHKNDVFTFLAIGYLHPRKCFDMLIKAFKDVNNAELLIIGDGVLREELKLLAKTEGARVKFLGQLSRENVQKVLASSHVLVSSSQIETFGMTIIEALASGIPAIATKSGGPSDILNSPELGILCEHNIEALKSSMNHVMNNYSHYSPDTIRSITLERYSESVVASKIIDLYNKILYS